MIKTRLWDDESTLKPISGSSKVIRRPSTDGTSITQSVYNGAPFSEITKLAPWYNAQSPYNRLIYNDLNLGEVDCGLISMMNPYILRPSYITWDGLHGKSQSKVGFNISNCVALNGNFFYFIDSCLPNCVGWAGSRIRELYYLINKEDLGNIWVDRVVPIAWKNIMPTTKIKDTNERSWRVLNTNESPLPGCVVIYSADSFSHVAFVEAVCNAGTDDEYAIISQSSYSETRKHTYINDPPVTVDVIRKKNNWQYYTNCKFEYFIRTCICDYLDSDNLINITVEVNENEITEEDLEKLRQQQLLTKNNLSIGDYVEIQWIGNEEKDGSGKNINVIGAKGWILNICDGADYMYEVYRDILGENRLGYFNRSGVKKWT